ncbi:tigger transposable element-derived protein 1 [Trichonephila clavipes]|nr:tigger transposable element-derived protein 1 [Trichonephila clavipes]
MRNLDHSATAATISWPKPDEIGNVIEEVVDFSGQINLEVDSNDIQELFESLNQELTINELIEMHEQEHEIEELESLDPVQSEDRMKVGNLIKGLSLIEKLITRLLATDLVILNHDQMTRRTPELAPHQRALDRFNVHRLQRYQAQTHDTPVTNPIP